MTTHMLTNYKYDIEKNPSRRFWRRAQFQNFRAIPSFLT